MAVDLRRGRLRRSTDEDEKGIVTIDTPGGRQRVRIINESGLYSTIDNHPGKNPEYDTLLANREAAKMVNKASRRAGLPTRSIPPQPNKYIPHIGAKERARLGGDGK